MQVLLIPSRRLLEGGSMLTGLIQDLGLQVLDDVIMTRWKVLPREQCQGKFPMIMKLYAAGSDQFRYPQLRRQFHH